MSENLTFTCHYQTPAGNETTLTHSLCASRLVIAGWTGRDAHAIAHHIQELEAVGVPAPSTVPLYYRASAQLLTQAATIEVLGDASSGEAEPVLFFAGGEWWLTVGSDHTDRKVETYSVAVSKQMCPKPVASHAWRWSEVSAYQDEIELQSRIFEDGRWVDYQRGTFASIRPLDSLREGCYPGGATPEGSFVSCGTLGAIKNAAGEGIRAAREMELEIRDPRTGRRILHRYAAEILPVIA